MNLKKYKICDNGLKYIQSCKSYKEAWNKCNRGDWMLWIAARLKVDDRLLTLTKGKCVELVIHLMQDQRSKDAVKAAINYGYGKINKKELKHAYNAAYPAAAHTAAAYAADIGDTDIAYAAYGYLAVAEASLAYAAFYDNPKEEILQKASDICRNYLTEEVFKKLNEV